MVTHEFGRDSRLLNPGDFQQVFNNATRFGSYHFTLLVCKNNNCKNRLGLAIAKKRIKKATDRNRIKRLIRESFRLNQQNLPHIDIVVMAKSGADKLPNAEIAQQLNFVWRKISKKIAN